MPAKRRPGTATQMQKRASSSARMPSPAPSPRLHVVLVPGFAGFDALGQLEYYAGVTPLFSEWQASGAARAVLHYFDNVPTASVATRAARLCRYLAKRWARGEIQPRDAIALVGHSTGGLDIRRALLDLDEAASRSGAQLRVDGDREVALGVAPEKLLEMTTRAVFLSVPQRGTNLADWVRAHAKLRKLVVRQLRTFVAAAAFATELNDLEEQAARCFAGASRAEFFLAVRDAIGEIDAGAVKGDPDATAGAHEAASELKLWLTHIASDFDVIDDLAARRSISPTSPAHFTEEEREREQRMWNRWGIRTRSYATVGRRPYDFAAGEVVPSWKLLRPRTSPWSRLVDGVRARVDGVYLCGYRACAGGPFRLAGDAVASVFGSSERRTIESWDNDGIVNTASMLWPDGETTRLVDADHGDIVGHFRLGEAPEPRLRKYHTYDLLRSDSGFTDATFREVWRDVFAFCTPAGAGTASEAA